MQLNGEVEMRASQAKTEATSASKRKSKRSRKVTVRLTEELYDRFSTATERPGLGKSVLVEAALERFLSPAPSVEDIVHERFDDMNQRFDRLEHDIRMMAETIALHARYHLSIVPPLSPDRQQEAVDLGDERFKVLAEQVDRRVRADRPLMQETIRRLNSAEHSHSKPTMNERDPKRSGIDQSPPAQGVGPSLAAAAGEGGSNSYFRCLSTRPSESASRKPQHDARHSDDTELTGKPTSESRQYSKWRLILSVFLPFAAGYYLAYLFRTINGAISPALASDFGLDAAKLGLLASVYFLVFGLAQIPIGAFLDRFGPRRVQGVLLVIAAGGATLFGNASSFPELLIGRAMIGFGVAGSLMAGLKSIVTWFPRERVALANGWMIMLGSFGAVTATAPTDWVLELVGWRGLFGILTLATVLVSGLIYMVVPEPIADSETAAIDRKPLTLRSIYSDPRFLRVAPLSAACIGSSWAFQSLWASAWLTDVEGLDRHSRAAHMFLMALVLSLGALLLGAAADRLRRRNIRTEILLACVAGLLILAEFVLILRVPLPSVLPWSMVSIAGAATVLSFAVVADYFPREFAARANGALNLLHFGWAFLIQYGIGLVIEQWPSQDGHYPIAAYQSAFGLSAVLQLAALVWFALPWMGAFGRKLIHPFIAEREPAIGSIIQPIEFPIFELREGVEW
jgi:MFS family permease